MPTIPNANPRFLRGHHWEIMLIAGAQQAAFTNPVIPHGMAITMAEVAKLVMILKRGVIQIKNQL